jgi:hypothetical protein
MNIFETHPSRLARKSDPSTSKEAAEAFDSSTMEELVYNDICSFGETGCIIDDIISKHPNIPVNSLAPRVAQLCHKKLVVYTGEKRYGNHKRKQLVVRKFDGTKDYPKSNFEDTSDSFN